MQPYSRLHHPGTIVFVALCAGLWAVHAANCPPIAFGPVPFPTQTSALPAVINSYASATGDFNGDNKADVVFVGNPSLVMFLGDGQGNFGSASNVNVGGVASSVAVADLNHDGKADLVLGSSAASIRAVLGRGDGTFDAPVLYSASATGTGSASLAVVADFDGDLNPDVAALLSGVGVSIVPGHGDGTFGTPRNTALATAGRGIAVGDWNGDFFPDVVCISGNNGVATFLNRGNGTLAAPTNTTVAIPSVYLSDPRPGDFDQDGILDLSLITAVGSSKSEAVILRGVGDGTFTLRQEIPLTPTALYTSAVMDVNGDGRLDIVIVANTAVAVLEGLGDGTFADPVYFTGAAGVNMTHGDYNKDGRPDLAVFSGGVSTTLQVMLNETLFLGPQPALSWVRAGALNRLVWYTNYANFNLEYRPSLAPGATWTNAPGSPIAIDCQNFYTLSSNYPGFYRLHAP